MVFVEASDDGLSLAALDGGNSSPALGNHAARELVYNISGSTRIVSWRPDLIPALGRPAMFFEVGGYLRLLGLDDSPTSAALMLGLTDAAVGLRSKTTPAIDRLQHQVLLAQHIYLRAEQDGSVPATEWAVLDSTVRQSRHGVAVDRDAAARFAARMAQTKGEALQRLRAVGLPPDHLFKDAKILSLVERSWRIRLPDMKRDSGLRVAADNPTLRAFITSLWAARTAHGLQKKYRELASTSRHVGAMTYAAAHTGRAASRPVTGPSLHQLRGDAAEPGISDLGDARRVFIADPSTNLVAADSKCIEPRIVAALSGDLNAQALFQGGSDPYLACVTPLAQELGVPPLALRRAGKAAVNGLNYGQSTRTFVGDLMASDPKITEGQAQRVYDYYQSRFPLIGRYREVLYEAFIHVAETKHPLWDARAYPVHFDYADGAVRMHLPTGRPLHYRSLVNTDGDWWYAPRLTWEPGHQRPSGNPRHVLFGDGQYRARVTPRMVIAHVVQATARDIVMHQALEVERLGLPVAFTVHDEIVAVSRPCQCDSLDGRHGPACTWQAAAGTLVEVMSAIPPTLPTLRSIPLAAEWNRAVRRTYA